MQPTGQLLRAVYFPGEIDYLRNSSDHNSLKKTLIYFDEVLTLVPEIAFTGDNYIPGYFRRAQRVERFLNDTVALTKAGILRCINPADNIDPRNARTHFYSLPHAKVEVDRLEELFNVLPELLFTGIVADICDDQFRSIVEQLKLEPIPLFTGQLEINWFSMLAHMGCHRDVWNHPDSGWEYGGFSAYVSPQLGTAVLLNHALIAAIKNRAIPIANNRAFDRLLRHKLGRMSEQTRGFLQAARTEIPWERDTLASTVLDLYLPDFTLQSFDDILELRVKAKDELQGFRVGLSQFAATLRDVPFNDLPTAARSLAAKEVEPALEELKRKLRLSRDKFLLRVVQGFKSTQATIPLIATVFLGLPIWLGCLISAGATIGEAALTTYFEQRDMREKNGLSFLLRFE
jgi:hypothetical protein